MSTPTSRTLKEMRNRGYIADVVERWIPQTKKRKDLFGFIDVLCVHPEREGDVVAVQATSGSNVSKRLAKIVNHENMGAVRKGGIRILIHGWTKRRGRWRLREVDVS
jgi:hypothetical protein